MKKTTVRLCVLSLLMVLQIPLAISQKCETVAWNQFRGGNRTGISPEKVTLDEFSKKSPKLLWKKKIGDGFSEIVVSGDKLYTMVSEKVDSLSGSEYIAAFEVKTGNEIWRTKVDSMFFDEFGDGPRSTPAIGKDKIYSLSSYGKLTANSLKDGKTIWQVDFMGEFGSRLPRWAFCTSPVLVDGILVMEVGGSDSRAFVGFDKDNGKVLWATGKGIATFSSPVVAEIEGKTNIVFVNRNSIYSLNSQGDTLWTHNSGMGAPTAMPVVFDSNKIFISNVHYSAFSVVEVKNSKAKEILRGATMKNDYSTCVYHNGCIYGFNVAALQCISATTGEKKWTKRGFGKGSLIMVGDDLLVLSDKGKLIQVKATPDAYTELGSIQAISGKSWTAPSYSGGKLYVRNLTEMACYAL
jgi:outer membrane protein assembly factor BamB